MVMLRVRERAIEQYHQMNLGMTLPEVSIVPLTAAALSQQRLNRERRVAIGFRVIQTKRVYEPHAATDGTRFLVERLWPRGIAKAALQMDGWFKDAAPSTELRRWFNHDPERWVEFRRRYLAELDAHSDAWKPILTRARVGRVTLLYSAHDVEHNNAVVLRDFLNRKLTTERKSHER